MFGRLRGDTGRGPSRNRRGNVGIIYDWMEKDEIDEKSIKEKERNRELEARGRRRELIGRELTTTCQGGLILFMPEQLWAYKNYTASV